MPTTPPKLFKRVKNSLIVDVPKLVVRVSEQMFDRGYVIQENDKILMLPIFDDIRVYPDMITDKYKRYTQCMPIEVKSQPVDILTETIKMDTEVLKEKSLVYHKGSVYIESVVVPTQGNIASRIFVFLTEGFLPEFVSYDELLPLVNAALELNAVSMGVPSLLKELLIGKVCRWKGNPDMLFKDYLKKNPNASANDMIMIKVTDIPGSENAWTALSSAYGFRGLNQSLITTNNNTESPIEDVLLG